MKRYYKMFIICLLTTTNIAIAGKSKTIDGTLFAYECGDNCYLTIIDNKGKEHTGLFTASLCQKWNEAMPLKFKDKKVRVTIGKGFQVDGDGNTIGEMDAFKKIIFINASPNQSVLSGKYIGKSEGSKNELKVQELGSDTIKFSISAEGTFADGAGGICTGGMPIDDTDATASIKGNTATYTDADGCTLRITFKDQKAIVKEDGCSSYHGAACDFNATYLKKR